MLVFSREHLTDNDRPTLEPLAKPLRVGDQHVFISGRASLPLFQGLERDTQVHRLISG